MMALYYQWQLELTFGPPYKFYFQHISGIYTPKNVGGTWFRLEIQGPLQDITGNDSSSVSIGLG
jgi:hypothetical protein